MSNSSLISGTPQSRGKLRVYLGYAAGVGKTYQMLEEARVLSAQGTDVVVGYYEPHARPETAALLEGMEVMPVRRVAYRGSQFSEMDCDAIVARAPRIALVDELPHTNAPGSVRAKRWEDVLYLLNEGIDVWTTVNVQHLESLNDAVQQIAGVQVRETIPDWVVQQASEVVMVDLTPRALLNRLDRGVIYTEEKAEAAKQNFFKESNLVALREFALREAAFEIESRVALSRAAKEGGESGVVSGSGRSGAEKILVLLSPHPSTAALVRRGKRVADYFGAECMAIVICPEGRLDLLPPADRAALEKHLKFAQNLRIESKVLAGRDIAKELASFVHQNGVTQIYLSRQRRGLLASLLNRDLLQQITRLTKDVEVTIAANRDLKAGQDKVAQT